MRSDLPGHLMRIVRLSDGGALIPIHDVSWHAMCFNECIEMTVSVTNAPGNVLTIYTLCFHGCPIGQPFLILREMEPLSSSIVVRNSWYIAHKPRLVYNMQSVAYVQRLYVC